MYFGVMNSFDLIVLLVLAYGAVRGISKGFVVELAGIVGLFLALYGAYQFGSAVKSVLTEYVTWDPKLLFSVSFLFLFIGILFGVSLLAKLLTKTLKFVALGWLNRLAGGLFGIFKWCILLSALLLVAQEINSIITVLPESITEESVSYPFLEEMGRFLIDWGQRFPMEDTPQII